MAMTTNKFGLSDHLATRERSLDFTALGMLLPNPDPILKAQGKDIAVYRNMRTDALVGGAIRRRKSAVKALEWGLDRGQAPSRVAKSIEAMLADLDLETLIGQALEATLYGYQPMEVMWQRTGSMITPGDVIAKPPEWFCFDADNQLRFKTRQDPVYGELLPPRKFLLPRQDATYQNPYGIPDLSMCFWPLTFKKGGLKFWLSFTEKFGSAWPIGKLPRSATKEERAELLDDLESLIQDGVAVIPDDGSIELVELAGKSASAELYERLVLLCRGEISIALLGQNQSTEATSNKASSVSGLEVTRDLRDADAKLAAGAINTLIRWVCEQNWASVAAPVFSLWDQEAQDQLQAARDKSNYEAGARFTKQYWIRGYGYQDSDLQESTVTSPATSPAPAGAASAPVAFAQGDTTTDPVADETQTLMVQAGATWSKLIAQVQQLVQGADSLPQVQAALVEAYGNLDTAQLVKLMAAANAMAQLKGMDAARSEG